MTIQEQDQAALHRCCNGNREAMEWLVLWRDYVHLIDDVVDEDLALMPRGYHGDPEANQTAAAGEDTQPRSARINSRGIERVNRVGALAVVLYTHPFFLKNAGALRQVVLNCTNAYADSALWEHSEVDWQRQWADHYRHFGAEMVLAVASICGGYEHMRSFSPELRCICYHEHHLPNGEPT